MKPKCVVLLLLGLLLGCARLPPMANFTDRGDTRPTPESSPLFPQGRWQLVHAIEAVPPNGQKQTMIGVSRICTARRTVHCVLMTLEGLVLFEADYDRQIWVRRAVGSMSARGFAEGLMGDILLIFFAPEGSLQNTGRFADGAYVRRYATTDKGTEDIITLPSGRRQICRYDAKKRLTRTVTFAPTEPGAAEGVAPCIALQAHGLAGYRLNMTLVEAQQLNHRSK
ncbi:MAG: hypothetical protein RBT11_10280 [Desulfobacterales bacterium]|jgi:hypothetical protein|nr:hypothetical protein [Desulfobacterales bacterium]